MTDFRNKRRVSRKNVLKLQTKTFQQPCRVFIWIIKNKTKSVKFVNVNLLVNIVVSLLGIVICSKTTRKFKFRVCDIGILWLNRKT